MALSAAEIQWQLAKYTASRLTGGMSSPPEKIAPNIYGTGTDQLDQPATTATAPAQQSQQPDAVVALSGTPKIKAATVEQPPAQPFKVKLAGGMVYEAGDRPGTRKFTIGTPGQDGGGVGTANGAFGFSERDSQAVNARSMTAPGARMQQPVQQSPAIKALSGGGSSAPQEKSPLELSHDNWKSMSINQTGEQAGGPPKYLTKEEGAALGLGWQGRLAKYKEDVELYNKATGNNTLMDIEKMRELGAGGRALLQANVHNDTNDLARQKLPGELALGEAQTQAALTSQKKVQLDIDQQKQVNEMRQRYMTETDPVKQRNIGRQMLALSGKDSNKFQVVTREEPIDSNNPLLGMKKTPYAIDPDTREAFELGGNAAGDNGPVAAPQELSGRKPGQVYTLPSGVKAKWDGKGWKPVQ